MDDSVPPDFGRAHARVPDPSYGGDYRRPERYCSLTNPSAAPTKRDTTSRGFREGAPVGLCLPANRGWHARVTVS